MNYDFDLFVIGAGSGGVRAARFSADFGARVAIAESRYLGGTCVNVGCVPKKLLMYGASFAADLEMMTGYGWSTGKPSFDWSALIANKDREIDRLNSIYRNLLVNSGVELMEGHARIVDEHHVEVSGHCYSCEHILIATGGWPHIPDIPGREHAISSNEAFYLERLPERILIVGGGYIAVEFASIFHALGSNTTLSYRGDLFLRGFDMTVRSHLKEELLRKGMTLRFDTNVSSIEKTADGCFLVTFDGGQTMETDAVFYATGRRPMLDQLGLENVDISLDQRGFIHIDERYRTSVPSILAIGDVIGRIQLTPVALAEGMAVARQLFRPDEFRPVDYHLVPTAVFSLPNIGTVGLTEEQARAEGHSVKVFESRFRPMKLTLTNSQERILMKMLVDAETDTVLGCHMVGPEAGEIIQGLAVALKAGATKKIFDETIGVHPSAAEEFVTMRSAR